MTVEDILLLWSSTYSVPSSAETSVFQRRWCVLQLPSDQRAQLTWLSPSRRPSSIPASSHSATRTADSIHHSEGDNIIEKGKVPYMISISIGLVGIATSCQLAKNALDIGHLDIPFQLLVPTFLSFPLKRIQTTPHLNRPNTYKARSQSRPAKFLHRSTYLCSTSFFK